jgi:hypothetical protein
MKANIFSHKILIGTADLKLGDESMGCVYGAFLPNQNYFDNIQRHVWEFWETNGQNYKQWYALRLNVQLDNGYFLYPIGGYTIDDIQDLKDEPKRIDIVGLYRHVIDDFFKSDPPKNLVDTPWYYVSIEEKIALENELSKELGKFSSNSIFGFLKSPNSKYILFDKECSALCKDQRNDDVLFVTNKPGFDKDFAVIHLTWTGKKEKTDYPRTYFYNDFEDFKKSRMDIDISEWED